MSATVSSYVPTASGTDERALESLSYTLNARPQAMSLYLRFIELGNAVADNVRVLQIGEGTNPQLRIDVSTTLYGILHNNGNTTVNGELAASPSVGDICELVGQLNADGSVLLIQSINGAASSSTTVTAAATLASAWSSATLRLNGRNTGSTNIAFTAYMNVVIVRGVHSLARMRRFAGVKQ